jgi:hypothetical protein
MTVDIIARALAAKALSSAVSLAGNHTWTGVNTFPAGVTFNNDIAIMLDNANSLAFWDIDRVFAINVAPKRLQLSSGTLLAWGPTTDTRLGADLLIARDNPNTLGQRNGANAQRSNVWNNWTDAANNDGFAIDWITNANVATIGTFKNGSGLARALKLIVGGLTALDIATDKSATFSGTGIFNAGIEDVSGYWALASSGLKLATAIKFCVSTGGAIYSQIFANSASNIILSDSAGTSFGSLQFGGNTNLFPALKRSSTTLQGRYADDSDFCPVQGKLTTDNAYTAGAPTATGYVTLYDCNGTPYKALVAA